MVKKRPGEPITNADLTASQLQQQVEVRLQGANLTGPSEESAPDPPIVLYKTSTAARILDVSPGMLRLSRHTGELFKGVPAPKFIRLGRGIRYTSVDLQLYIEQLPKFATTAEADIYEATQAIINHAESST